MKIRQAVFLVALFGLLFVVASCDGSLPEVTQTFKVTTQPVSGSNLRLLSITSTKSYLSEKQNEVRSKLESTVNSGKFNIVSVKMSYSSSYLTMRMLYSPSYLTSAEVTYNASGRGDGNSIRVIFISNDNYDLSSKTIKYRLDAVVNSGKYDIVKINTMYAQGYLITAEVFYREKR